MTAPTPLQAGTVLCGTAVADITPPAGAMMAAFPRGPQRTARRACGAHDSLRARAIVLSNGRETAAICACDLTMLRAPDAERIRGGVAAAVPELSGERCILCATHTHHGPETAYLFGNTPDDPWVHEMDDHIAGAITEAFGSMQPARLAIGRGRAELAHNRRVVGPDGKARMVYDHQPGVTTGPSDADLRLLRLDDPDGRAIAFVFNFAAHALAVGPDNDKFTADFPGIACGAVESRMPGATALFLNGAAGDQHPRRSMRQGFEAAEAMGSKLAAAVGAASAGAERTDRADLAFASKLLSLPNRMDESLSVEVELSCLRAGPMMIGFMPGEPFVQFQLDFKRAMSPAPAMLVGYANAWVGYLPTRDAYAAGGYGVDAATDDPPRLSRTALPPGSGERLLAELVSLARQLSC